MQAATGAALNIYSRRPHALDGEGRGAGRDFATYAGVALANMHL